MTFAFASCQQYEHGYYTAYKHMAKEKLDLVFHLGDYIYEYGPNEYVKTGNVRTHSSAEVYTLSDYRNRHAQYRSDANLKAAHAAFPWVVTWDDHEVENNYANIIPEKNPWKRLCSGGAAYQAYYEHMPLRRMSCRTVLICGCTGNFLMAIWHCSMCLIQDSTEMINGDGNKPPSDEWRDPKRTLMGTEQEQWLFGNLAASKSKWNVLAQQIFSRNGISEQPPIRYTAWIHGTATRRSGSGSSIL